MDIRCTLLSRRYLRESSGSNQHEAVHPVDLTIRGGELLAIMGRSGSGKSTLLHMLSGVLTPTTGQVMVGDTDLYALSENERAAFCNCHLGVIPQGQSGLRALTVLENVVLPAKIGGKNLKREEGLALLDRLGIGHLADVYPNELSGGEMRRMAIARALVMEPEILMADEPTGDLDDENTQRVLELLREQADAGRAVLLVTHEAVACRYADRVCRMQDGCLEIPTAPDLSRQL